MRIKLNSYNHQIRQHANESTPEGEVKIGPECASNKGIFQTILYCTLKISKNMFCNYPMNMPQLNYELDQGVHYEKYIKFDVTSSI